MKSYSDYMIISNGGVVLTLLNCKCILVYTLLKIDTEVAETCWRIPCIRTTSKYYCTFVGIKIVFVLNCKFGKINYQFVMHSDTFWFTPNVVYVC